MPEVLDILQYFKIIIIMNTNYHYILLNKRILFILVFLFFG